MWKIRTKPDGLYHLRQIHRNKFGHIVTFCGLVVNDVIKYVLLEDSVTCGQCATIYNGLLNESKENKEGTLHKDASKN